MGALDGKVAIVTGGSRGIGRGIAGTLAHEGAQVVLAARTEADLTTAVKELQGRALKALGIRCDVSRAEDVQRLVDTTIRSFGTVDILVNNAGVGVFKNVVDLGVEEFDRMWGVNMRGTFLACRAVLPSMMKARSGAIVNIASLAGKNAIKGGAGYVATKWAMRGFASSLMLEVREYNIRVITIFPGSVDTSFSSKGKRGEGIPTPEDVASAVLFGVMAPERAMFSEIDVRPTNPPK